MNNAGKVTLVTALIIAGSFLFAGENFPNTFQATMDLKNKPAEAEAAFVKLAEQQEPSRYQAIRRNAAYFQAADSAGAQGQFERALALADKITDKPLKTLAKIKLLGQQGKLKELLELAKSEDISAWPEALIYDGAMCRAGAAMSQNDSAPAEKDYLLALQYTMDSRRKAQALVRLGDIYAAAGKNEEALASYRKVMESEFAPEDTRKAVKTKIEKLGQ